MLKKRRKRQGPLPYLIVMNGRISLKALHFDPSGFINFNFLGHYLFLSERVGGGVIFPPNLIWF